MKEDTLSGIVVIGSQWGDEGKGKVVDVFSAQSDYVVRYQGGANAGHTLIVNGKKTVLHLVPSGVLHDTTKCIIGPGVVLDVETVVKEIDALKASGHLQNNSQLLISDSCTVIMPYHRKLDLAREQKANRDKIGTTGKGIGPAYEDRASRKAILMSDLYDPDNLLKKIKTSLEEKNFLLEKMYNEEPFKPEDVYNTLLDYAEKLRPYRCKDSSLIIHEAMKNGKKVLFEGAQGTLLDLLHGTYPFVTSSSTLSGSACIGSGMGPGKIGKVIGITKAYTTRVGSGPFPTELINDIGIRLRDVGKEYGATTGRERRCGWLDLVALNYAIRINGITSIALMKIDVLSGFDEIKVCTGYEIDGEVTAHFPTANRELNKIRPVYETLEGWKEDITSVTALDQLPRQAKEYIQYVSSKTATPIDVVSVGPGREQTLWIQPLFQS